MIGRQPDKHAINYASDLFHDSKQWDEQFGARSPAENIERLAKEAAGEISRLRALGLEACDALTKAAAGFAEADDANLRMWADLCRTKAERIRKELTRG